MQYRWRFVGVGSVLGVVSTLAANGCENFVAGSIDGGAAEDDVVVARQDAADQSPPDTGVPSAQDAGKDEDAGQPMDTAPPNCAGRTPVDGFSSMNRDPLGIGVQPTIASGVLQTALTSKAGTGFSIGLFDVPSRNLLLRFEFQAQRGPGGAVPPSPPSGVGYKIAELLGGGANNISLGLRTGGWAISQFRTPSDLLSAARDSSTVDTNWHTASLQIQPSVEAGAGHLVTVRIDNGTPLTLTAATLAGSSLQVQLGAYYNASTTEPESRVHYRNVRYWTCMP